MGKILAACMMMVAQVYSLPPAVLIGIYQVEAGQVGQAVGPNKNGSYDLGPMQINTVWVPELANMWGISEPAAKRWIKDDPCTNVEVAAWILRQHLNETQDLDKAVAHYHSRTKVYGDAYKKRVISSLDRQGLIK